MFLLGFTTIHSKLSTINCILKVHRYYSQLAHEIVFYLVILITGVHKIRKKHGKHSLFTKIGVVRVSVYIVTYILLKLFPCMLIIKNII